MSGSITISHLSPYSPPSAVLHSGDHVSVPSRDACCVSLSSSFFAVSNPLSQSSPSLIVPVCTAAPSSKLRVISAASNSSSNSSSSSSSKYEEYEAELEKPIGLKFYKGRDGGVYIDAIAPGGNADNTKKFTPGDRVLFTSAVFGTEMWPAAAYGQTMYTIRQRIGTVALKMEKRFGEREDAAVSRDLVAAERNAGIIGERVREIQIKNYMRKMELKQQREEDLDAGLRLYRTGDYKSALDKFDSVLGAKPDLKEERVANYNIACCYSKLNEVEAGLSALEAALEAGFEDYKTLRSDSDLGNLRASPKFKPLVEQYDEPFINENAVKALKSVFGLFGGKK